METKVNLVKRTFADVYGEGYSPYNYTGQEYTERIKPFANNVYVLDCVFRDCSSESSGGALYNYVNVHRLLVEQSLFFSCKASNNNGGAVFFSNTNNGQSVLVRICGFNCSGTKSVMDSLPTHRQRRCYINRVNDSSFTHCLKVTIHGLYYILIMAIFYVHLLT